MEIMKILNSARLKEKEEKVKAIFIETNAKPCITEIKNELKSYQQLVGGYIEVLSIKSEGMRFINLIYNDMCKSKFEEVNKRIVFPNGRRDYLSGNIICLASDWRTGDFESLTDEEVKYYLRELAKKELAITMG